MSRRLALRLLVISLTLCLIADMAMPLLPGAFRLDPSESVEVVSAGRVVPSPAAAPAPRLLVAIAVEAHADRIRYTAAIVPRTSSRPGLVRHHRRSVPPHDAPSSLDDA